MSTPRTEAGKALVGEARPKVPVAALPDAQSWWGYRDWARHRIAAIEAEAVATERKRIRPWVEAIGCLNLDTGRRFRKADVLRVIDGGDGA